MSDRAPRDLTAPHHAPYSFFFFNDPAPPEIYPLSLHDALPIFWNPSSGRAGCRSLKRSPAKPFYSTARIRSEEHTSELQSPVHLVCRLLLEKKKHSSRYRPSPAAAIPHAPPPCAAAGPA